MTPPRRFTFSRRNYGKVNPLIPLFIIVALLAAYYAVYHSGLLSGVVDSEESGRIEIFDVNCSQDEYENWEVTFSVRSVDEADFRLSKIFVKGMEVSRYRADSPTSKVSTITSDVRAESVVPSGEAAEMKVWIGRDFGFLQPTQRVSIRIQDSSGVVYTTSVMLSGTL